MTVVSLLHGKEMCYVHLCRKDFLEKTAAVLWLQIPAAFRDLPQTQIIFLCEPNVGAKQNCHPAHQICKNDTDGKHDINGNKMVQSSKGYKQKKWHILVMLHMHERQNIFTQNVNKMKIFIWI